MGGWTCLHLWLGLAGQEILQAGKHEGVQEECEHAPAPPTSEGREMQEDVPTSDNNYIMEYDKALLEWLENLVWICGKFQLQRISFIY